MMLDVKIWDGSFGHAPGVGGHYMPPTKMRWQRPQYAAGCPIDGIDTQVTFYADMCFNDYVLDLGLRDKVCRETGTPLCRIPHLPTSTCKKVAWLIEPRIIAPTGYAWMEAGNWKHFDKVITHERELCGLDQRFVYCPAGGCWVAKEHHRYYGPRENVVSIIASNKTGTPLQKLRHEIIDTFPELARFSSRADLRTHVVDKDVVLKRYRWSVVVENCAVPGYFTEKLLDCVATGCVPIYFGDPAIGLAGFDLRGIPTFTGIDDLRSLLSSPPQVPTSVLEYNYEVGKLYFVPEDWLYDNVVSALLRGVSAATS